MDNSHILSVSKGEIILREGERSHEMYKILSGNVALYLNYGKNDEYLIGILSVQQCFGEMNILCDEPAIYTAVSVRGVVLLRILEDDFNNFLANNPKNAISIMRDLAKRISIFHYNMNLIVKNLVKDKNKKNEKIKQLVLETNRYIVLEQGIQPEFWKYFP